MGEAGEIPEPDGVRQTSSGWRRIRQPARRSDSGHCRTAGKQRTPAIRPGFVAVAETGGFEPPVHLSAHDSLAMSWFKPLTHVSSGSGK